MSHLIWIYTVCKVKVLFGSLELPHLNLLNKMLGKGVQNTKAKYGRCNNFGGSMLYFVLISKGGSILLFNLSLLSHFSSYFNTIMQVHKFI